MTLIHFNIRYIICWNIGTAMLGCPPKFETWCNPRNFASGLWGGHGGPCCQLPLTRMVSPKTPVRNMIKVNLESMDSPLLVSELAFACETKKSQEPLERRKTLVHLGSFRFSREAARMILGYHSPTIRLQSIEIATSFWYITGMSVCHLLSWSTFILKKNIPRCDVFFPVEVMKDHQLWSAPQHLAEATRDGCRIRVGL